MSFSTTHVASSNIPPQPTPLIDRDVELTRLITLLIREDVQLLTLTGPGGVGKTRLAIAAAESVRERFPDGVWFVDLAPVGNADLVLATVARVVGVREHPGQDVAASLAAFLRSRRALFVIDNLEHLIDAALELDSLVAVSPTLTMLVTSREPLKLRREQVIAIHPLPVPDSRRSPWAMDELEQVPAIALFVARARAADVEFGLHSGNAEAVAELSRRLDGLPLAMELAAARTRLMSPAALLARLEHSLSLLRWDTPDLPLRHRTLQATLDWSYALLSHPEQVIFRRLGVFAGGFTLEAVEAVAATSDVGAEPLDVLQGLVDKHLVRAAPAAGSEPRFSLLATVRDYAVERLVENGEADHYREQHFTYYLALAEAADRAMLTAEEILWLQRLDREVDNLRLAHDWAMVHGYQEAEWRFVAALWYFWVHRGALQEGRSWSAAARAHGCDADPLLRARFFEGAGLLEFYSGEDAPATADFTESVAAASAKGDRALTARMLGSLGIALYAQGDANRAYAVIGEMVNLARASDSRRMVGEACFFLAMFAIGPHGNLRDRPGLLEELDEGVACLRESAFHRGLAITLACRSRLLRDSDASTALTDLREALELARGMGDPLAIGLVPWLALVMLAPRLPANRLASLGGAEAALSERSAAQNGRSLISLFGAPSDHASLTRSIESARAALEDREFMSAWEAGRLLTFDEVIGDLLAELASVGLAETPVASASTVHRPGVLLSVRESEVLALLVLGLSDREIGVRLHISPRTVSGHVTNLLRKLGVNTRTAAVTHAIQHGLVHPTSSSS